ncbi:MAG TPA: META domain-containing protein [Rhodanobacteraceae bacterium]|nr:META domain-containing protein [Rhodanobacteraceae bacterium]
MRRIVFVLLAVIGVAGCSAQPVQSTAQVSMDSSAATPDAAAPGNLRGTDWRFVEVEGSAVPNDVVATLRLSESRASGKAGCNSYGASWQTSTDGGTRFGQIISTKMACLEPAGAMQVERGVFDVLQHAVRLRRHGDNLVLLDASGQPLAKLAPEGSP